MRILISATLLLSGASAVRVGDDEPKKYQSPDDVTSPESVQALMETKQAGNADKHTIGHRVTMKKAGHRVEADSNAAAAAKSAQEAEADSLEDAEGWFDKGKEKAKDAAAKVAEEKKDAAGEKGASMWGKVKGWFGKDKDEDDSQFWGHDDITKATCKKFVWSFKCDDDNARKGWVDMGYVPESSKDYKKCGPKKDEHCSWCCPPEAQSNTPPEDAVEDPHAEDGVSSTTPKDNEGWGLKVPKFGMPDWGGGMPDFKFPGLPEGQKINDPNFPGFDINLPVIKMPNLPGFPGFNPDLPETPGGPEIPGGGGGSGSGGGGGGGKLGSKEEAQKKLEDQIKKMEETCAESEAAESKYNECVKSREKGNAAVAWIANLVDPCKKDGALRDAAKDKCDFEKKETERAKKEVEDAGDCDGGKSAAPSTNFDTSKETKDIIDKVKETDDKTAAPGPGGITLNGAALPGPGGISLNGKPVPGPGANPDATAGKPVDPTDGMDPAKKEIYQDTVQEAMDKGMTEKGAKDIAKKATDALKPLKACGTQL